MMRLGTRAALRITKATSKSAPATTGPRAASILSTHRQISTTAPAADGMPGMPPMGFVLKNVVENPALKHHASMAGKTLFVSGASRGIGLAVALAAAREGANVAVAAKTDQPHPKLEGTIHTAAAEIEAAGGNALPLVCDVRDEASVQAAVDATVAEFGGLDVCVNNASAISLTPTTKTDMKRYDLMHSINTRGTFLVSQKCIPHLAESENGHIINMAPPLDMDPKWFAQHVAYTMAKYGMSMCVLGMSAELRGAGVGVNALWPRTTIATAAVQNLLGGADMCGKSRTPAIMGDAAHAIMTSDARRCTGNFFIDDEVMVSRGVRDFSVYNVDPALGQHELVPDFFV